MAMSLGVHAGIILATILAGVIANSRRPPLLMGGGSPVSVEMVVLDPANDEGPVPVEAETQNPMELVFPPQEEAEEVQETVEPAETVEVTEPVQEPEDTQPAEAQTEQVQENTQPAEQPGSGFIGVGASGEAGAGAPGPASYEGRVFAAIRRNFVTSMSPQDTYRIHFTVNTDGSHSYEVVRRSGNAAFDRAVEHALETANIPPMPPGRATPVRLSIEFMGPE
jgi:TonB family protein